MIPKEKWGRDHHSLILYVESACVNEAGKLDNNRMRTDRDRHPLLYGHRVPITDKKYPTRLAEGIVENHDDWDCLDDLEAAGLIEIISLVNGLVTMTDLGYEYAARLRRERAERTKKSI